MGSKSDLNVYNQIHDKLRIAKNILAKCDTPPESNLTYNSRPIDLACKICFYTGVDVSIVEQLLVNSKEKKTFLDWLRYKEDKYETSVMPFERIRNVIIDQYVNKLMIPTKTSIFKGLETDKSNEAYTLCLLKQDLNTLGFIWKRLPKSEKYILVENTKQVSDRMKYLQKMKEYRKSNRVLIHIGRTVPYFPSNRVENTEIMVVASPQLGFIDAYFPPKQQSLNFWLGNKLHTLPNNLVFVLEQSNRSGVDFQPTCELPTMHSKKGDMITWLETYNIPHDSTMHRGELFALIEKHKVHCPPLYKICEHLKAAGHDVIICPPELSYIGYFKQIMKLIFENRTMTLLSFKTYVTNLLNDTLPDFWLAEDERMAAEEQKIYEEDLELELILDNLMEAIKYKGLSVSDADGGYDKFDREFYNNVLVDAVPMVLKERPLAIIPRVCPFPNSLEPGASTSGSLAPGTSQGQPGPSNK